MSTPYDYDEFVARRNATADQIRSMMPDDIAAVLGPLEPLPKCRHFAGGTEDCSHLCLTIFGDAFAGGQR